MLRLTGLPHRGRYPEATVQRDAENILIRFSGPYHGEQEVRVPLKYTNAEDDETVELELLAQLQRVGYDARRG